MDWDKAPEVLKVLEASKLLQLGINQTYELCHREDFPAIKFGKQYRIPKNALRQWLEKQVATQVS